jgi:hypothetical protein
VVLKGIHDLIAATDKEPHRFPPTLIYSEGWMLRLVLQWFATHGAPGHPLSFEPSAIWFSEALLPSPFRPRHRGDRRAEARTHADGILGHFTFGSAAKADARLRPDATQLVVAEAKIHSPLSGGTRNAPTFDQAARNVACITELLTRAGRRPDKMQTLAFYVVAPQRHIEEGGITAKLQKASIENAVLSRAEAFAQELCPWLEDWFHPALRAMRIEPLSWEQLIQDIDSADHPTAQGLRTFYERCLKHNGIPKRAVPA